MINIKSFKYKFLFLGASAIALLTTSCKDFLDQDVYDQYSSESVKTYDDYLTLTSPLYGGYIWSQYEGKFSWCVNEGLSGILFNVNDQEGALFCLNVADDNSILLEGYKSLYSGVIATANQVIKKVRTADQLTNEQKAEIEAEARLFRGYAHFLATEYFGEVPLVWNSEGDISENITLPRVSRKTLYEAIRKDFQYAADNLPTHKDRGALAWRASKESAQGMLAKLYLTMASCQSSNTKGCFFPFSVTADEAAAYYNIVDSLTTAIIESAQFGLTTHSVMFDCANRTSPSSESIFSLYWKDGAYGEGSAYQSQIARDQTWSPGSGWGVGKGLTYTLYNSFDADDARKRELCFYAGSQVYETASGKEISYSGTDAKDFLQSGQWLMNNIKKFIWGINVTAYHQQGMSYAKRDDILRLSDVYLMRAEARLALEDADVEYVSSNANVIGDINNVLEKHGAPQISSIAFFENWELKHGEQDVTVYTLEVDDRNGGGKDTTISISHKDVAASGTKYLFHTDKRTDLLQQRRKEFAMEGQSWLDLKRFYYRNPEKAERYLYQMDRGVQFSVSPLSPDEAALETEAAYERRCLVKAVYTELNKAFPGQYTVGDGEVTIYNESFIAGNKWFLPIPTTIKQYLSSTVEDLYQQVYSDTYPY